MAELVFFSGTMNCGKSTLALQLTHTRAAQGLRAMLFTCHDRAGSGLISSRLGISAPAVEVVPGLDVWQTVTSRRLQGPAVDFLVCDEAQFYSETQIEQLARVVDDLEIDVFAFGFTTDFRTRLFPGSSRLLELADRVESLQAQALCWCGARATHNARTVGGHMVVDGERLVVGDVATGGQAAEVAYETLCRRHHMRRMAAADARASQLSPDQLDLTGPIDLPGRRQG